MTTLWFFTVRWLSVCESQIFKGASHEAKRLQSAEGGRVSHSVDDADAARYSRNHFYFVRGRRSVHA